MTKSNFVAFILTHGRPDNVITYKTLRKNGYTGRIIIVVDDTDKDIDKYKENFKNEVVVFNKKKIAKTFDSGDNFDDMRTIVYARNACFVIAKYFGIKDFIQLDDDYTSFGWRFDDKFDYIHRSVKGQCLDDIFAALADFRNESGAHTVALAQGGDYIGGGSASVCFGKSLVGMKRKAMNSFVCSTDKPFQFNGRINEDVNTYTHEASKGLLMFTINQMSLEQKQTQSNKGGMTDTYLDGGTYIKSFYSVMYQTSSVTVKLMGFKNKRLHHSVNWKNTTPMILNENLRKK